MWYSWLCLQNDDNTDSEYLHPHNHVWSKLLQYINVCFEALLGLRKIIHMQNCTEVLAASAMGMLKISPDEKSAIIK